MKRLRLEHDSREILFVLLGFNNIQFPTPTDDDPHAAFGFCGFLALFEGDSSLFLPHWSLIECDSDS